MKLIKKFFFFSVILLGFVVIFLNSTKGHFDYPDNDGCSCFVEYINTDADIACEKNRTNKCDLHFFNEALLLLNKMDFNR